MAVTAQLYTSGVKAFVDKEWNWTTDTFKALLLKNTYTFNQNSHVYVADVVASSAEVTGGSYARVALASKTDSGASGIVKLTANDITFAAMTATGVRYMVVFQDTGSDATAKVLACINFGADIAPTAQAVTVNLSTDGIVNFTL